LTPVAAVPGHIGRRERRWPGAARLGDCRAVRVGGSAARLARPHPADCVDGGLQLVVPCVRNARRERATRRPVGAPPDGAACASHDSESAHRVPLSRHHGVAAHRQQAGGRRCSERGHAAGRITPLHGRSGQLPRDRGAAHALPARSPLSLRIAVGYHRVRRQRLRSRLQRQLQLW